MMEVGERSSRAREDFTGQTYAGKLYFQVQSSAAFATSALFASCTICTVPFVTRLSQPIAPSRQSFTFARTSRPGLLDVAQSTLIPLAATANAPRTVCALPRSPPTYKYGDHPKQDCDISRNIRVLWTSKHSNRPFMGCCFQQPLGRWPMPGRKLNTWTLTRISDFRAMFLSPEASSTVTATLSSPPISTGTITTTIRILASSASEAV